MSTSESVATWLSLLEEKKREVKDCSEQGYSLPEAIVSGRSFRSAFEELSRQKGEHKYSRLEAKLLPSLSPISDLAKAVDQSVTDLQHLAPNESLECLIWRISFGLIERGCRAGAKLTPLITLIAEHNKKVPRLSTNEGRFSLRFPNEKRVQKPLQDLYSLFIDSHLFIISYLRKKDPSQNVDPTKEEALESHITETARRFQEARGRYDVMVNQAAQDEERKKMAQEQPSLSAQRDLSDHLHQNSRTNRAVQAEFVSIRALGGGSFGEVDEVREISTGASYARKHIHLRADRPPDVIANEVQNEVAIMQKLRHPHIANVLFYLKEKEAYSIFMLPVADHDLGAYLRLCIDQEYPAAMTKQIYPWFGCVLDALAYAHRSTIKHQDIKPSNILIKNHQPLLCDFGLEKDFARLNSSASDGRKMRGNLKYRAPEIKPGQSRGRKADVFSLGCVYSEMFTVTQAKSLEDYGDFRRTAGSVLFRDCLENVWNWMKGFEGKGNKLSDLLVDQILNMINKNTTERHTAEQAMNFLKPERALFCIE